MKPGKILRQTGTIDQKTYPEDTSTTVQVELEPFAGQLTPDFHCPPPPEYYIDPGNFCNLKCPFCATGNGKEGRSKGWLSKSDYQIILDKITPYAKSIGLYNYGEPFLNQAIIPMVTLAAKRGIHVHLSSNFSFPGIDYAAVVRSGLADLYVSIDGLCQDTYGKYHRGGNLELVLKNIKELQAAKKRLNSETPNIIWYFLIHKFNEHEMQPAKEMARKLGVSIGFDLCCVWDETWESSFHRAGYVPQYFRGADLTEYNLTDRSLPVNIDRILLHPALSKRFCGQLFTTMTVNWNGNVYPCCTANNDDLVLGNLLTTDLEELWNNQPYRKCREYVYNYGSAPNSDAACNHQNCALKSRKVLF